MQHKGLIIGIVIVLLIFIGLAIWYFAKSKDTNNTANNQPQGEFTVCGLYKDESVTPTKYSKKMCNNKDCNEGYVMKGETIPIVTNCNYVQVTPQEYVQLGGTL